MQQKHMRMTQSLILLRKIWCNVNLSQSKNNLLPGKVSKLQALRSAIWTVNKRNNAWIWVLQKRTGGGLSNLWTKFICIFDRKRLSKKRQAFIMWKIWCLFIFIWTNLRQQLNYWFFIRVVFATTLTIYFKFA